MTPTTTRTRRTTRAALLLGLIASLGLAGGGAADAASKTPLDTNLVTNPGAEAGAAGSGQVVAIPGWNTTDTFTAVTYGSVGHPSIAESGEIGGGSNLFACGNDSNGAIAAQRIKLSGRNALIDSGNASVGFGAYLGGTGIEGDNARVIVRFLSATGKQLDKAITHVSSGGNGNMVLWSAGTVVPAGTRVLRIVLQGKRFVGADCDAFFDNVYLNLFD
jgi:hypothetical protein